MYFGIKNQKKTFFLAIRDVGAFIDNSFFGEKNIFYIIQKNQSFFFILKQKLILEM
jgi:hypothetical protein